MSDPNTQRRFTALLAEHESALRKVILTYASSTADREDLQQEVHVQLWRSFVRYDAERPFATWMYRVALNVAISHARRNARDRAPGATEPAATTVDPRSLPAPVDDRVPILERLLADLDELDRALLLLHLEERSYAEIAEVLGITATNVGTRLNRLRTRLREMAREEIER